MSKNWFQDNLSLWSHSHPKEAVWLQYVNADHLHLYKIRSGLWNLKEEQNGDYFYFHDLKDPLKESQKRFSQLKLSAVTALFCYGVGLGYDFKAAKKWLEEDQERRLIFLEDDLAVIARLFETELGNEILRHPQTRLYYFQDLERQEAVFNELFWHFFSSTFASFCSSAYERRKPDRFRELASKLDYDFETKKELLEEYLHFGATFYRNFYVNLFKLPQAYLGNALFGKFKNIPAIICGAGPSLQKNIGALKQLTSKALLFAGSSALNALAAAGIQPHFGVGIDPNPKQGDRLSALPQRDFPFFYRSRIFPRALDLMEGPKLYVTGAGGYEIAEWLEKQLGIEEEALEEGHNVVNFALELAHALGCNPIIFVGMDLAYTEMRLYSPGVIAEGNLDEKEDVDKKAIVRTDITGKPVYTLWKWVAESRWIAEYAKEHPETTLINATEGGIGFEGVSALSLKQAAKKWLKKSYRLSPRISKEIKRAKMPKTLRKKVMNAASLIEKGLVRCLEALETLREENHLLRDRLHVSHELDPLQTPRASLVETELVEEEAFRAVLQIFNEVYSRVLDKEIKALSDPSLSLDHEEKLLKKLDLNERKYAFLAQAARVNLELLRLALAQV